MSLKPIGLGAKEKIIGADNKNFAEFVRYISGENMAYKVRVDSWTVPALINHIGNIDLNSLDICDGAALPNNHT